MATNQTPYATLDDSAFWKKSVAQVSLFDIEGLWQPKFNISPHDKVATYGSCFAQHIGNALQERGFSWLRTELPPEHISEEVAKKYSYNIFSSRTANIYTTSLLNQWVDWATGKPSPQISWRRDGRFFDPFRPNIEPDGFSSEEELLKLREQTISCFHQSIKDAKYFVFTLGLTESWSDVDGYEYPMCPGTVAGTFDGERHKFENQPFKTVKRNLMLALNKMRKINPKLKFILTVSPVPLTATNSGQHVLVATMRAKSILRSVAATISENKAWVDYFPSYEIINSPAFRGTFFEPNLRSVNPAGVNFVMNSFFRDLTATFGPPKQKSAPAATAETLTSEQINQVDADEHCEEALLEAFAGKT